MNDRMRAWFTPQMLAPDGVIMKELEGIAHQYDAAGGELKVRAFDELMVESDKLQAELWRRAVERGMVDVRPGLCNALFPQLSHERWGELNINDLAGRVSKLIYPLIESAAMPLDFSGKGSDNPFLNPTICEEWTNFIHHVKGVDYSWGGYMEDRSVVWAGHYHKPGEVIHLGVDFYVPARTWVHMPCPGKLVHKFYDPDQDGGWGGQLVYETEMGFLIFGHLKNLMGEVGDLAETDKIVGVVAEAECNGNWSPHLHVQLMAKFDPKVDGYSKKYDGMELDFPNPLTAYDAVWRRKIQCVVVKGRLGDYALGHIDLTERLRIAGHLAGCRECSAVLEGK